MNPDFKVTVHTIMSSGREPKTKLRIADVFKVICVKTVLKLLQTFIFIKNWLKLNLLSLIGMSNPVARNNRDKAILSYSSQV